jgi:DNA-directed RNA polymerase subunit RPC12/RpoP
MDFPINHLMSEKASTEWILEHFHPDGLRCPHCGAGWAEASEFRTTRKSQLTVYRCKRCHGIYNLYSGTIFEAQRVDPIGVCLELPEKIEELPGWSEAQISRHVQSRYRAYGGMMAMGAYHALLPVGLQRSSVVAHFDVQRLLRIVAHWSLTMTTATQATELLRLVDDK